MTPVQTLYRWFNDNPEATYKEISLVLLVFQTL
jgi:hypothetical protein